jgi:mevalonate pyrophosphate decarboxylase
VTISEDEGGTVVITCEDEADEEVARQLESNFNNDMILKFMKCKKTRIIDSGITVIDGKVIS